MLKIKNKYRNLRVFMISRNVGTYITSNTMLSKAVGDKILRFDSDDTMRPEMIEKLVKNPMPIVRMRYCLDGKYGRAYSWGQAMFDRQVFEECGGYAAWPCTADRDLMLRASKLFPVGYEDWLFDKRVHSGALTVKKDTGKGSAIRKKAGRKLELNKKKNIIFIPPKTAKCYEHH